MQYTNDEDKLTHSFFFIGLRSTVQRILTISSLNATLPPPVRAQNVRIQQLVQANNTLYIVETFIDENQLPHLLFYGPPGTGKTSAILACARKLYGDNYKSMVLEVG